MRKLREHDGLVPNCIVFHTNILKEDGSGVSSLCRSENEMLTDNGRSRWWQHSGYVNNAGEAKVIDIGVLPLQGPRYDDVANRVACLFANVLVNVDENEKPNSWGYGFPLVGSEVFILGYPQGLMKQGTLPVWKRGSIAA